MRYLIFIPSVFFILLFSFSSLEEHPLIVSNILSALFVLAGAFLATFISYPLKKIKGIVNVLKDIYIDHCFDYNKEVKATISLAREFKKHGFMYLVESAKQIKNPYIKKGVELIADNYEWDNIKRAIEREFFFNIIQTENSQQILRSMSKYAPAFGLAGTIIGMIKVFPNLADPAQIGVSISFALLTTLYGVLLSNLLFLPLANKMKDDTEDKESVLRFSLEAVKCIYDKEYSVVIQQRLELVIPRHELVETSLLSTDPAPKLKAVNEN